MTVNEKWEVIHSPEFKRCVKDFKLYKRDEGFLIESIEKWFQSEQNLFIETASNKEIAGVFGKHRLFDVHLPSMYGGKRTGKSKGYRLIVIYNPKTHTARLGMIFRRQDLDYKGEKGKKMSQREEYLAQLESKLGTSK